MAPKIETIVSDGTMEHFYRLFRFGYPQGTIKQFHDWFTRLGSIQNMMAPCPWCGTKGSLMVEEHRCEHRFPEGDLRWHTENAVDPDRLVYFARCEKTGCLIGPTMYTRHDTPEEARDTWEYRKEVTDGRKTGTNTGRSDIQAGEEKEEDPDGPERLGPDHQGTEAHGEVS